MSGFFQILGPAHPPQPGQQQTVPIAEELDIELDDLNADGTSAAAPPYSPQAAPADGPANAPIDANADVAGHVAGDASDGVPAPPPNPAEDIDPHPPDPPPAYEPPAILPGLHIPGIDRDRYEFLKKKLPKMIDRSLLSFCLLAC